MTRSSHGRIVRNIRERTNGEIAARTSTRGTLVVVEDTLVEEDEGSVVVAVVAATVVEEAAPTIMDETTTTIMRKAITRRTVVDIIQSLTMLITAMAITKEDTAVPIMVDEDGVEDLLEAKAIRIILGVHHEEVAEDGTSNETRGRLTEEVDGRIATQWKQYLKIAACGSRRR